MEQPLTRSQKLALFEALNKLYPNPKCELNWSTNFSLLVAIMLSAQNTDKGVNKVTEKLFQEATTPEEIRDMGPETLRERIKSINYFNNKAKAIYALSLELIDKFNSEVPDDFDTLITLPGIGRKTANVFLNVAFNRPTMGVDTHVYRVSHRLKLADGRTPVEVERKLRQIVPAAYRQNISLQMVLHGRYTCRAIAPRCGKCALVRLCTADEKEAFFGATVKKNASKRKKFAPLKKVLQNPNQKNIPAPIQKTSVIKKTPALKVRIIRPLDIKKKEKK